jgi:RNA polymerase sigma-70 factor, ECF subfamily
VSGHAPDSLNGHGARLVSGVRAGEPQALGALYDLTAERLRQVARRALTNDADAEDVVHDLFVGLPEALRHYRESGRLMSWLVTCTMRLALMRRRAGVRRRESAFDDSWQNVSTAPAADRPDLAPEVDEAYRRIAALPDGLRDVVLLRSEGLSHAEIAETLGISEGNSRIRLTRALERLLPPPVVAHGTRAHSENTPHD